MAGKSNKNKSKGRATSPITGGSLEMDAKAVSSSVTLDGDASTVDEAAVNMGNAKEEAAQQVEGEANLYPVSVKTQSGEKLELQLSPGDSVMDIRQFLLDAPETCFFTCYDLILHTKDGSTHLLEDYNEISEVTDITTGCCSLEMISASYDDRSIRSHVSRARDLLSLSTRHTSLSTMLALQHETTETKTADAVKVEASENDDLGFMEDITGSLQNLMTSSFKEIKCTESIVFSSFNPPPSYRRLVGDLIYIDVVTLEGNKFCITGATKSFYVNSSIGDVLDPTLAKQAYEATTLVGLLQKISSKFKKGFRKILERKAAAHPFENVQSLLPPNSWLGVYPIPDHKRDAARAEDSLTLSYGSELIGMQRDWNEELQSCREFPHTTLQERILRDRALYKVTCDFVDAARSGAIGVISRCVPSINPTDPECFHMYVHNNIFFSFAVDTDLELISKDDSMNPKLNLGTVLSEGSISLPDLSAKASNTVNGISGDSTSQIAGGYNKELKDSAVLSPDSPVGAHIADNEQATYASANNDLKGTKAYLEADVPGLYNLAMAIIDYRGYRVVAQGIIPGILQGDKSDSLLYGSVDNGKKICWDESFHSKVLEAAKRLHLKEHAILDGSGNVVKLAAPVECKGIVGSDDRHYILDLMRITPRDVNYGGPGSRFCVLRPELVASFCEAEAAERSPSKPKIEVNLPEELVSLDVPSTDLDTIEVHEKTIEACISVPDSSSTSCEEILLNPNVFTEFKLADSEEEIAADVAYVRKAGSYLIDVALQKFVQDLCALEVSPIDGQTLTDALHAHGINVRYLGKVANLTRTMPHLWDMCTTEIVVRSAKHLLKDVMRESQDHELGPAVSHFLNCFMGQIVSVGKIASPNNMPLSRKKGQESNESLHKHAKGQMRWSNGSSSKKCLSAYMVMTSEGLWSYIKDFAKAKYQFELPEDAKLRVKKVYVVRNLCQKVGVILAARKYDLDASSPFQISDILNLQPVVKHSFPVCSEARYLIDTGKAQLAEGMLNEAYTLFSEAFSILQQVTGPMHREVATCCRYLAMVLYHAGDMEGALAQQHKELIINERCLGLDHPDTAHSYGNMALFYHGLNQTELALRHMSRTLLLLGLSSGPDHPEVAAMFINVAMMYQDSEDSEKMSTALRYLQEALKKNERLLGQGHIQTAVCYHALAIAFNCLRAYKLSVQHEQKTYDILVKQLGKKDSRTRDSEDWLKTFKNNEKQAKKQKEQALELDPISPQEALDFFKARPDLLKAFQAAANGNSASMSKLNAALKREALPRGRKVDERAIRAASEVHKKAVAKGLHVRPTNVSVQSPPVQAPLQNVNSGSNDPEPSAKIVPQKETSNSRDSNGGAGVCEPVENQDQAPVGLGTSLASLDSRKLKSKAKAIA